MLAQLGKYVFKGVETPNTLSTTSSVKYETVGLINGKGVLQKTGYELDTLTLAFELSVYYCDPDARIAELKTSMTNGERLPLVMGDGSVAGKYVITKMDVTAKMLDGKGLLESATVTLTLSESPGDDASFIEGSALESADPTVEVPADPVEADPVAAANDISEATSMVNTVKKMATDAKDNIEKFKSKQEEVKKIVEQAKELYQSAKEKIESVWKIVERAGDLPDSLDEVITYIENLESLEEATDMAEVNEKLVQLLESVEKVGINTAPLIALVATKESGEGYEKGEEDE